MGRRGKQSVIKKRRRSTITNASDRYGINLTKEHLEKIARDIREGRSNPRQRLSDNKSVHEVVIGGRKISVIYTKSTGQVTIQRKKLRIIRTT